MRIILMHNPKAGRGDHATLHFDSKVWPRKNKKAKTPSDIEIMVKPSALVILQPGR